MDAVADDPDRPAQGWFVDPFGIHEQRWFSQGSPSALVRDGRLESQDPPPDAEVEGPLVRASALPRPVRAVDRDPGRNEYVDDDDGSERTDHRYDHLPSGGRNRSFGRRTRPAEIAMPAADGAGTVGSVPSGPFDGAPFVPRRIVWTRWAALGFAVLWTLLLTLLLVKSTTTTHDRGGHAHVSTVVSTDPGGVIAFVVMLAVAVAVTGVGFVRRLRRESGSAGWAGYACAGILGILGLLSLSSIGLTLLILGATLVVVARPLRRPRPLPGERVV